MTTLSDILRPQCYETERSLIIGERQEKKPAALVAQLAERRFRNPSLLFRKGGGYLRSWVQIPSRAFILVVLFIIRDESSRSSTISNDALSYTGYVGNASDHGG